MLVLALGSIAHAGTVCAVSDAGPCDRVDLQAGLDSSDPVLELRPGLHIGGVTVDRPVEIVALPGARIEPGPSGGPVFDVVPAGSGSVLRGLVYDDTGLVGGPMVAVHGADVRVVDAVLQNLYAYEGAPGFVADDGATLRLDAPIVEYVSTDSGRGVVRAVNATLVVDGGRFVGTASDVGGAIWAVDSELTITGTRFEANYAWSGDGNTLWAQGGTLALRDVDIVASPYTLGNSSVRLVGLERATITGGTFEGAPSQVGDYGVWSSDGGELVLSGPTFRGWRQSAVFADGVGTVTVDGAVFEGNTTPSWGAAMAIDADDLRIDRSWFCGNVSQGDAGAIDVTCRDSCVVSGSVFQDNRAVDSGGAIWTLNPLGVDHSTFVGNRSPWGGAVASVGSLSIDHTILVFQEGAGPAVAAGEDPDVFDTNALGYNKSFETNFDIDFDANRLGMVPVFVDAPGRCGIGVTPTDANGWILEHDVGAIVDIDDDGFLSDVDCDDGRTDVFPGAAETVADGVDEDCDGTELCPRDGDGDGWAGATLGEGPLDCRPDAPDCDDTEPDVHPEASDPPGDGIDADCSGNDPDVDGDGDGVPADVDCDDLDPGIGRCRIGIGGGCGTIGSDRGTTGSGSSGAWVLVGWLALRRRALSVAGSAGLRP